MIDTEKLETMLRQAEAAHTAFVDELLRQFLGAEITFMIMHDQKVPSTGRVTGVAGVGYLRVTHHEAKPYSWYAYRDVHFRNVLTTRKQ